MNEPCKRGINRRKENFWRIRMNNKKIIKQSNGQKRYQYWLKRKRTLIVENSTGNRGRVFRNIK
jgi:hypothetical protein